jgi:cytochrome c peroxidase
MKKTSAFYGILALFLFLTSCGKEGTDFSYYYYTPDEEAILSKTLNLPSKPYDYTQNIPAHLRKFGINNFGRLAVPNSVTTLGRVLFYDKKLSKDGTISCASCHEQKFGFGDNKAVSKGVFDRDGDRNSIPLASVTSFAATYGDQTFNGSAFFWDNRARTAEEQAQGSMENEKEMAMTMDEIAEVVKQQDYYQPLFEKAFPHQHITSTLVLNAVAAFVNSMGSFSSRFDEAAAIQGEQFDISHTLHGFTKTEESGKNLYIAKCASCHGAALTTPVFHGASNGLDVDPSDLGIGKITKNESETGLFKIPTLRNIAITGPYMHDGRFATLEQVIDHYSTGIKEHKNLHALLRDPLTGKAAKMNFTADEKQALIAFLNTLTDEKLVNDARFSNPFK